MNGRLNEGRGSRTAERVAAYRAVHQLLDRPLVFEDPLALVIVGAEVAARIRAEPRSFEKSPVSRVLRAMMAVRSRFAEDELRAAVARGVAQYVVLGAGLDTFAYRNPFPPLQVFEVDHPATQAAKRQRLEEAAIDVPTTMRFVPVDFTRESLRDALLAAGFSETAPACFSWLGVVPYLELSAIQETLRFVASLPRGTSIVFDYGSSPDALGLGGKLVFKFLSMRVASIGEPWKTFFDPSDLLAMLRSLGFSAAEDFGPPELNARYLSGRADGLHIGEMAHIAKAAV